MALDDYLAQEIALDCAEGAFTRREAMRRLVLLGLTAPAATALLAACSGGSTAGSSTAATAARTATIAAGSTVASPAASTGASIAASASAPAPTTTPAAVAPSSAASTSGGRPPAAATEIRFPGPAGELVGVFAAPAGSPRGAVLVIHENRGLTAHIRSIPARLAGDGYASLAIDLLSEEGGTASLPSEGDATAALGRAPAARLVADLRAGLDELARRAAGAKLAAIGFCFGGGMTWQLLAAGEPRLSAAVPFYGPAPADADFRGSPNAAVLGVYGGRDTRVNATQDAARRALESAGLVHELRVFDGADHAFFNDTGTRYDPTAAAAAYQAMLAWFAAHLG